MSIFIPTEGCVLRTFLSAENFSPGIVAPARIFSVAEKFHPQKECFSRTNVLFCAGYVGFFRSDCCCGWFRAGFGAFSRLPQRKCHRLHSKNTLYAKEIPPPAQKKGQKKIAASFLKLRLSWWPARGALEVFSVHLCTPISPLFQVFKRNEKLHRCT